MNVLSKPVAPQSPVFVEPKKVKRGTQTLCHICRPSAYHAKGVLYLSPNARFDYLLALPEWEAVGKALSDAIRDIEKNNPSLASVLPKTYEIFNSTLLKELLKKGDCLLRHPTEQPRTTLNGKIMLWDLLWESRFWGPESPIVWIKCIGVTHLQ
jgi:hypothetical protein